MSTYDCYVPDFHMFYMFFFFTIISRNFYLFCWLWRIFNVWVEVTGLGHTGRGHVRSLHSSGQYSLILSYKYHCRSLESPIGAMIGGKSLDGITARFLRCCSFVMGLLQVFLKRICPGESLSIVK